MITVIFRSRLRDEHDEAYRSLAAEMLELARSMPGFVSFKRFAADDAERVSIIEFESLEAAEAWRDHPKHRAAQERGRRRFYSAYRIQVCRPIRSYRFDGEQRIEEPDPDPA